MKNKEAGLRIDAERLELFLHGARVAVSPKEFKLARALMSNRRAWTREQLLDEVWGPDASAERFDTRTVDQHVARLRAKLGQKPSKHGGNPMRAGQQFIETVSGHGYRLAPNAVAK